jgi:hypothetical protein
VSLRLDISEAEFQRAVVKVAKLYGWLVDHTPPMRNAGGDIYTGGLTGKTDLVLFSLDGKGIVYAELKTQKGKVSPSQAIFRNVVMLNGGEYFLWRPADMDAIVERLSR